MKYVHHVLAQGVSLAAGVDYGCWNLTIIWPTSAISWAFLRAGGL